MVNWCPRDGSAISDREVGDVEMDTSLWYVRYPGADGSPGIVIATQRPETIMADVAVGVHPDDDRYRGLVGTHVLVPIVNRRVPVIADARVDPQFGTGALKITPGHALVDNEIGADHGLPVLVVLDPKGRMTPETGKYAGMDRFEARKMVGEDLKTLARVLRSSPTILRASNRSIPAYFPVSGVMRPLGSNTTRTGRPWSAPISLSTRAWPGVILSAPVPNCGSTRASAMTGTRRFTIGTSTCVPTSPRYRSSSGCTPTATSAMIVSGRCVAMTIPGLPSAPG